MFKNIFTLVRGVAHAADEGFQDKHTLLILQQQLRESTQAVQTARKAVAVAIAQNEQEVKQYELIVSRIEDLETRAICALEKKEQALAEEAAQSIAILEDERDCSKQALERFAKTISKLKSNVQNAETRLRDLKRGELLANATDKTQKMMQQMDGNGMSSLSDAEATLERLRIRQSEIDLTRKALEGMESTSASKSLIEKLAEAGCGEPVKTSTQAVLERLNTKLSSK